MTNKRVEISQPGDETTVALFGDSIAEGLGVRENKYGYLVARSLGARLIDYSSTGWTVSQSLKAYDANPVVPTLALIAHGVTEPILRPNVDGLPLPRRWKRTGWMDPRPYYSRRRRRRLLERLESGTRWRVKNLLLAIRGGYQFMDQGAYETALTELVERLTGAGASVIILGPPAIDDKYFPRSSAAMDGYAERAERIPSASFLPLRGQLKEWDDFFEDHFHPNERGHAQIAELVLREWRKSHD